MSTSNPIIATNTAVRAKAESTYGVAALTADGDAVIANKVTVKIDHKTIDANLVTPTRGGKAKKFSYTDASIDIECDLALGGANEVPVPGSLPQWDILARACALQRLFNSTATTNALVAGGRSNVTLDAGESEVDGFYAFHSLSVAILSGTAQASGSAAKNVMKLAAATAENSGTADGDSTTTLIILGGNPSGIDDDYVGQTIVLNGESRTITAYNGTTHAAIVGTAFSDPTGEEPYKILFSNAKMSGYLIAVKHYNGTIIDTFSFNSTTNAICLPYSVVGTQNLAGMYIKITTGGNDPETLRIGAYDVSIRKATLNGTLANNPNNTSTFEIIEKRTIAAFNPDTVIATVSSNFYKAPAAGATYSIEQARVITSYTGATQVCAVSPPFSQYVATGADYTLNPYIQYTQLPSKTGEASATIEWFNDGLFYRFVGCKGSAVFGLDADTSAIGTFSLKGSLDVYDDVDMPDNEMLSRYVPSQVVCADTINSRLIVGFADAVVHKWSADLGNDVQYRNVPGDKRAYITDCNPMLKITVDKGLKVDWDYQGLLQANTKLPTFVALGDMGNQVILGFPQTQITACPDSNTNSVMTADLELMVKSDFKIVLN
ncbi:hypothetical protein [Methylovulum psychrotolerans]|uniref:Uncharacterized protein n=1 Tax=Methylovulum psychrotolerans TaxID=1704499 RepID=A0A2S5CGG5_9GAMM|nr:hypothetical protein [Methylovulum psychrotolerans]POZ49903.1 hypothetical protein AADEFJLK_04349 [Methylovulum psychrotolerans]